MKEILDIYDLDGNHIGAQDRKKFYADVRKELSKTGKTTKQAGWVQLILMNSKGNILLQRRSKKKNDNPNLYDKTVGGHVNAGHTDAITMVRECAEELGIPSVVVNQEEFYDAVTHTDLEVVAVLKKVEDLNAYISERQSSDESYQLPAKVSRYIGYYDGSIQFRDAEASGVRFFELNDLKNEIDSRPEHFTWDIKKMVESYEAILIPVKKL